VVTHAVGVAVEGLVKRFRGVTTPVLDGLSLQVSPGEVFGLLGRSGSGKTTLLRIIAGFDVPDAGRVRIGERVVQDGSRGIPAEGRGVGFVFQQGALFPHLTVRGNLEFGLTGGEARQRAQQVEQVLSLTGLQGLERRYPHELSAGEQQRAALARALVRGARVVLLDEPLTNVDSQLRAEIGAEVRTILKSADITAILVTHDRDEAFLLADRLGILHRGILEQVGDPEELYHRPVSPAVARFLGAANFLTGAAEDGTVHTELGPLTTTRAWPPGSRLLALLRPTDCVVRPDPTGQARIAARVFRGGWWSYRVQLPSGTLLDCDMPASMSPLAPGDAVRIEVVIPEVMTFPA
jgi:iron(III) transport system ATP-binding protein